MVKKVVGLVAIAALLVSVGLAGVAMAQEAEAPATPDTTEAAPVEVGNTVCPVCDTAITGTEKYTVVQNGKIYNLCSENCKESFLTDPDTYAALAEAQVAALQASQAAEETATTEATTEAKTEKVDLE